MKPISRLQEELDHNMREMLREHGQLENSEREVLNNQRQFKHQQANLRGQLASFELLPGNIDSALRFSALGARFDLDLPLASPAAT
jgi:hypothetical protein